MLARLRLSSHETMKIVPTTRAESGDERLFFRCSLPTACQGEEQEQGEQTYPAPPYRPPLSREHPGGKWRGNANKPTANPGEASTQLSMASFLTSGSSGSALSKELALR